MLINSVSSILVFPPAVEDFLIHDLYLLVGSAEHETTSDRLKQVSI